MDYVFRVFGLSIIDSSMAQKRRQKVMDLPAFYGSKAVNNNQLRIIPSNFYATPLFIVEYAYTAKWFHPELFPDLDPKAIHREYLMRLMRLGFDLPKHGVFVYLKI